MTRQLPMHFLSAAAVQPSKVNLEIVHIQAQGEPRNVTLIFVHGIYHAAWAFADELMPYFSKRGYDCYGYSWRGHGTSEGRETLKVTSFDDCLSDLRQVIELVRKQTSNRVVLIGHSAGAALIQKHLESESADGAIFISATSSETLRKLRLKFVRLFFWPILKMAVTGNPDHFYHDRKAARWSLFSDDDSPKTDLALDHLASQNESHAFVKDLFEVELGLPKETLPTLVVSGGRDLSFPQPAVDEIVKRYSADSAVFKEGAHELFLMPGWEKVAEKIDHWLIATF